MARLRRAVLAVLIAIGVLAISDSLWMRVSALVPCVNPDSAGAGNAWPASTTINVNLSNFPATLQPCAKTAFDRNSQGVECFY
jgi:hypothetical protein